MGGGCPDFPSKLSCLTVPEAFVGQPFRESLISGIENFMLQCVMSRCFVDFVCVTVPKKAVGKPFSLSLNSGIEKVWMRGWGGEGGCPYFPSKFLCLIVPKGFVGQPFRLSLIPGMEKFYASEGYVTIFCRICWCNSAAKIVGEPFCVFTKFLVSKKFMDKRGEEEEGSITIFCRNFFVSVLNIIVEEPFCAAFQKNSGSKKNFWIRGGGGGGRVS